MRRFIVGLAVLSVFITDGAAADETVAASDLQQVVEQSADRFADAFGKQDAAAVTELFTDEAEYIDASGTIFHGKAVIASEFAAAFELQSPGTMTIELLSIRPVSQNVLVEDGISSFAAGEDGPVTQTRYTATHVRQDDGRWLLASVRELNAGNMTAHDRLQALQWLTGRWHEDVGGNTITSQWDWSDDTNFLIGRFSIRPSFEVSWTGTHRIGWDAGRRQFRSWVFESNGGSAEGWWRPNEDGSWSVNLSGVDAQGVQHSSVITYLPDGDNAVVVSHDQRVVGGESLPGTVHRVVRQPPGVEVSTSQR